MPWVRMSALAGLLRGDHWPGFSVSSVAGLLEGFFSLGVLAVAGMLWGNIISWVRVPAFAQLRAGVHSRLS